MSGARQVPRFAVATTAAIFAVLIADSVGAQERQGPGSGVQRRVGRFC